jgi:hypothetical protein
MSVRQRQLRTSEWQEREWHALRVALEKAGGIEWRRDVPAHKQAIDDILRRYEPDQHRQRLSSTCCATACSMPTRSAAGMGVMGVGSQRRAGCSRSSPARTCMTDRKAHLLALPADCKREANRLFANKKDRHHAERYLKLREIYIEMADAIKERA